MCGIAGIFAYGEAASLVDPEELLRIREAMWSRGPDGAGLWLSTDQRTGLAHRRLAIIDLSDAGAQPMSTCDGRLHVTFNGEIYNYRELRSQLEGKGYRFHSNCDTEVLLHLYADRGEEMVHALRGMYAFGIWDERNQGLFLARDPFGIKPLYYANCRGVFRFASQVKALLKGGAIDSDPEPAGSAGFLVWGFVPEPYTLYKEIHSLPAGSCMRVSRRTGISISQFFDIAEEFRNAEEASEAPIADAAERLSASIRDSVRSHQLSDVPVGLFLSAGIDSVTLAGLASEAGTGLKSLTLGFPEFRGTPNDEVPIASLVSHNFGIRHEAHWITHDDFRSELEPMMEAMDQPSIDGVNTYFVSRAAAKAGMKVALSGLGGDELFGGYPSFRQVPRLVNRASFVRHLAFGARLLRRLLAHPLGAVTSPKYASAAEYGGTYAGAYLLRRSLYLPWEVKSVLDKTTAEVGLDKLETLERLEATIHGLSRPRSRVAALELSWYLRNQLLRDADWAGMAHSVEIRVPLVDVVLFRALAPQIASKNYPTKSNLAGVLRKPLPSVVTMRPKSGFGTPVKQWLLASSPITKTDRGLRSWAKQVLPAQPKMFRALVLVTDAFGGRGGIAKFNRDVLETLASTPECANAVAVPRLIQGATEPIPLGITFKAKAAGSKVRFIRAALIECFRKHVDLVVVGHINLAPMGILIAFLKQVPSLLIVHGIDAWAPHDNILVKGSISRFTNIVGVSDLTLSRFAAWTGACASKLRLLPNCVDITEYGPGPKSPELAERLGLTDRTVVMTLGRLESRERFKGFDEIIDALPRLAEHVPNISYLICGDGSDRARLEQKANTLGIRDRVVFAGYVPEAEKANYYRLADAYVMPSRGEGFGIVLLEALACGIPVMGSLLDGSREALLDGDLGCLVDPTNPDDVVRGVLDTLRRDKGKVQERLAYFSRDCFSHRVRGIVRDTLCTGY